METSPQQLSEATRELEKGGKTLDGEVIDIVQDTIAASHEYSAESNRKLLRKIDLYLLPLMWICYGTQQADKVSIATQATFGLKDDTGLVGQQYSWLTTIFYLSYLLCEGPGNYILQRVHVGRTLAACMFVWGWIVLCIGFAHNWATLMALRALQGAAECTISPAFMLITATWWTSNEHTSRAIFWGTANSGMEIVASLINYGIGRHAQQNPEGLSPWRGISFFLGALTICLSLFAYLFLGTPREVRWLSEDEKRQAAARVIMNQTGTDAQKHEKFDWKQFWIAVKDPQTYFFFFVTMINGLPNGGTTSFGNLVYTSFGFSSLDTLVKGTIPQDIVAIAWFLLVAYISAKRPTWRFWLMIISVVPGFVGFLALALLPNTGLLWVRWGMFLMTVPARLPGLLIWTFLPSNVAGRTKKTITSTVIFVAYCAGNSIGPQVFQSKDAPRYIPAIIICATMYAAETLLMIAWRTYYVFENRRRDRIVATSGMSAEECLLEGEKNAEMDMTDCENIHFRYSI